MTFLHSGFAVEQNSNFGDRYSLSLLRGWESKLPEFGEVKESPPQLLKILCLDNWDGTKYPHMFAVRLAMLLKKEPWELMWNVKCRNSYCSPIIYIMQKPGSCE